MKSNLSKDLKRGLILFIVLANVSLCAYLWGVWAGVLNGVAYALAFWSIS
jgi:hypothetical protein